jgi:hypothetical protein
MELYYEPEYPRLTKGEYYFPPALLENPGEALPEYYQRIIEGLRLAVTHKDDPEKKAILEELDALAQNHNLSFLTEEKA